MGILAPGQNGSTKNVRADGFSSSSAPRSGMWTCCRQPNANAVGCRRRRKHYNQANRSREKHLLRCVKCSVFYIRSENGNNCYHHKSDGPVPNSEAVPTVPDSVVWPCCDAIGLKYTKHSTMMVGFDPTNADHLQRIERRGCLREPHSPEIDPYSPDDPDPEVFCTLCGNSDRPNIPALEDFECIYHPGIFSTLVHVRRSFPLRDALGVTPKPPNRLFEHVESIWLAFNDREGFFEKPKMPKRILNFQFLDEATKTSYTDSADGGMDSDSADGGMDSDSADGGMDTDEFANGAAGGINDDSVESPVLSSGSTRKETSDTLATEELKGLSPHPASLSAFGFFNRNISEMSYDLGDDLYMLSTLSTDARHDLYPMPYILPNSLPYLDHDIYLDQQPHILLRLPFTIKNRQLEFSDNVIPLDTELFSGIVEIIQERIRRWNYSQIKNKDNDENSSLIPRGKPLNSRSEERSSGKTCILGGLITFFILLSLALSLIVGPLLGAMFFILMVSIVLYCYKKSMASTREPMELPFQSIVEEEINENSSMLGVDGKLREFVEKLRADIKAKGKHIRIAFERAELGNEESRETTHSSSTRAPFTPKQPDVVREAGRSGIRVYCGDIYDRPHSIMRYEVEVLNGNEPNVCGELRDENVTNGRDERVLGESEPGASKISPQQRFTIENKSNLFLSGFIHVDFKARVRAENYFGWSGWSDWGSLHNDGCSVCALHQHYPVQQIGSELRLLIDDCTMC